MIAFFSACALLAQTQTPTAPPGEAQRPKPERVPQPTHPEPLPTQKNAVPPARETTLEFSLQNIDKSASPCTDFYQYACGNWLKNNPIPPDQPEWVSFAEVYEHNLVILRQILEKAARND